jgi:acyl carrier protein
MPETITIEPRLRKIIAEQFEQYDAELRRTVPKEFEWGDELKRELKGDSLDVVELVMAVEEEFNIEITDEDVDRWNTAGDVLRCVEGKRHG